MAQIAIIGAGMAGVTLANYLAPKHKVTLFEKSRSVGGRMSVRRAQDYSFDHGTQFFTAKTDEFKNFLCPLIEKEIIKSWNICFGEFHGNKLVRQTNWQEEYPHYVATGSMNKMVKYLAKNFAVKLNTQIAKIVKQEKWSLFDIDNKLLGEFDWTNLFYCQ